MKDILPIVLYCIISIIMFFIGIKIGKEQFNMKKTDGFLILYLDPSKKEAYCGLDLNKAAVDIIDKQYVVLTVKTDDLPRE